MPWIHQAVSNLRFETVLDAFGGTGSVSYLFKRMGKQVTFNDYLLCDYWSGVALIENSGTHLTGRDVAFLLSRHKGVCYPTFISDTFRDIYYTEAENKWLDQTLANIAQLDHRYGGEVLRLKRSLAYHCLFQSCLMKRPFNLFHRRNLNVRTAEVPRTFGNKTTWETPFPVLFRRFAAEMRRVVFDNGRPNRALNLDALALPAGCDLIYVDTPYLRARGGAHDSDYRSLYHFLEGMCHYGQWGEMIDYGTLHRGLLRKQNGWNDRSRVQACYEELVKRHSTSIIVISYRTPGVPSRSELESVVSGYKKTVCTYELSYRYALNKRNGRPGENIELLIVGT
jgi:adenine-specific DNA methylase